MYAQAVSQLFPLAAALTRRGRLVPVPARWVLAWCSLLVVTDLASLAVAYLWGENLWLQYFAVPLGSTLVLWGLSEWQLSDLMRLAYRLTIPMLVLASAAVFLTRGSAPLFDEVVGPFHELVLLAASLHTVVHRALRSDRTILGEPWFWIGMGLSLYFAASVAIGVGAGGGGQDDEQRGENQNLDEQRNSHMFSRIQVFTHRNDPVKFHSGDPHMATVHAFGYTRVHDERSMGDFREFPFALSRALRVLGR